VSHRTAAAAAANNIHSTPNDYNLILSFHVRTLFLQTNLMILYLEAVNYKVVTALATLEGHPPAASNTFSQHIETTRDKNGYQMSVLKVRSTHAAVHRSSPPTEICRTVGNNIICDKNISIFLLLPAGKLGHGKHNMKRLNGTGNREIYYYILRLDQNSYCNSI